MISGGGKYWAVAGSGAAKATSASPAAAHRTAFAFTDAFLVCDLLAARRDLSTREPAEEIPSGAAPTHSPIRVARCASERRLASLDRSQTISAHRPEGPSSALLPYPAQKGEFARASSEMHIRHLHANLARQLASRRNRQARRSGEPEGHYFPAVLASASLQPSLMSAACDFMHCAKLPLPRLTSAQSFFSSALQALPTAAARMIAT